MEDINKLFEGFKVLTTPYDKVDHKVITKKNIITAINQIGGKENGESENNGSENGNGESENGNGESENGENGNNGTNEEGNAEGNNNNNDDNEKKPGILDKFKGASSALKAAKLAAAERSENDKGTEAPDGKAIMKKVIKVGTIIIYIMLLPLLPWYYIMKYSFEKFSILYKGIIRPL